jgi:hypothetical protein
MTDKMAPMEAVRALLTFADLDDQDSSGCSVSVRHEAVLSSGDHVLLLDDRGWSSNRPVDDTSVEEVERAARVVVGPDEPAGGESRRHMAARHWAALERTFQHAGIRTDGVELKALPHKVELSDRLRKRLKR